MSVTRNLGLRQSRGELVAFIDADDRWRPAKLREQVAIFDRFPDLGMVCGTANYWRSWEGGRDRLISPGHILDRPVPAPEASLALYPLGKANAPCPSTIMVRRWVALSVGGFEESFTGPLQMYEDQAFLAKLYLAHTVYFAEACWLDYRVHDRSCVSEVTRGGGYDEVRRYFLRWFEDYLAKHPENQHPAAIAALDRALLRYRHPFGRPLRLADKVRRKLART